MGMPAPLYRWYFHARRVKSPAPTLTVFTGIRPIKTVLIGMVEAGDSGRKRWIERMTELGRAGR